MSNTTNLFQVTGSMLQIYQELEEVGGELTPELEEALAITQENLDIKVQNYNYLINVNNFNNLAIDSEIERLKAMKVSNNKLTEILEERLLVAVKSLGIEDKGVFTLKLPTITLKTRKSTSIEIEGDVDDKFLQFDFKVSNLDSVLASKLSLLLASKNITFTPTTKVSKTMIKDALKNGETVLNAREHTNYNLVIK
jgi:hypothetical protein